MRLLLLLGLFLSAWAGDGQAQDLPGLGTKATGTIALGRHILPLPDGEWTVAAVGERSSASSTPIGRVILAQLSNGKLSRWVYISTNLAWNGSDSWKRDKGICERKSVHFTYSDDTNSTKDAECWILNHTGMTLGENASQIWIDFYRWSDSRGRPNTALVSEYFLVKSGDVLTYRYYVNPVLEGFPDTPTGSWRGNPWHADIASKDAHKLEYLRSLKATGQALFEKLKTAMNSRS
jgi:hypothetical protein